MKRAKDNIPKWLMYLIVIMVILFILAMLVAPGYDHTVREFPSFRR